jgi:cytochrome P450
MRALTLQIVVDTVFHADVGAETTRIGQAMVDAGVALAEQIFNPLKAILPDWLPVPFLRRKRQATAVLDEIVYRMIAERRRSGRDAGDLISMFLFAVDEETGERMSDRQVRDEVATLFIAGHETTALTLGWAWALLARHPEVEARLHTEVDRVLSGRPPSLADLPNLAYTEMIVKETLRLYPPAWMILRQANDDVELGGYRIRRGEIVMSAPYVVQRSPLYYDEPYAFQPERFAPDASNQPLEKRLPRFAYFPFGGGPRICIGNSFAMLEATLALATVAQSFRLTLLPGEPVEPAALLTLTFKNSVPMQVVARRR